MAGTSVYHAQAILNTARTVAMASWTPYLALYYADPDLGGSEVFYAGYARQSVVFGAPVGKSMSSTNLITFPAPAITLGPVPFLAVFDALVGGTIRSIEAPDGPVSARTLTAGQPFTIAIGNVVMSLTS